MKIKVWVIFVLLLLFPNEAIAAKKSELRCSDNTKSLSDAQIKICQSMKEAAETIRDKNLSPEEKTAHLREIYRTTFDTESLAKFAAGRYWKSLGDEKKADIRKYVEDEVVVTLTNRFREYGPESIIFNRLSPMAAVKGLFKVLGIIEGSDGSQSDISWVVKCQEDLCKVVDVEIFRSLSLRDNLRTSVYRKIKEQGH